jgi:hypothetical protein
LPRTPEHKGTVENSVGYVKHNALAARVFDGLAAQNLFLSQWEASVADCRSRFFLSVSLSAWRFKRSHPVRLTCRGVRDKFWHYERIKKTPLR